jgi:elongation factor G
MTMSRSNAATALPPVPASPAQIRNIVLVGPSGGGKSTLFDRLVSGEGARRAADQGASTALRVATIGAGDLAITLLDTPGAADFVGEVRAGLRAADAALFVVAAGASVDDASKMLWRECAAVGMPRAVALTKLEQCQDDYATVVAAIQRAFGAAQPLQVPVLEGESVTGLIDLLGKEVHDASGASIGAPTGDQEGVVEELRGGVLEAIIEESEDESMLDRYLSGEELDATILRDDLRAAIAGARFFPIVPTHWASGVGVAELLALFENGFPAPTEAWMPAVTTPDGEHLPAITGDPAGPLVAEVIRTTSDQYVGRLSLVRVFSGTLSAEQQVHVSGHLEHFAGHEVDGHPGHDSDADRVGQISSPTSGDPMPRTSAIAGEVVLVTKLAHAETSDTVSTPEQPALVQPWLLPEPHAPGRDSCRFQERRGQTRFRTTTAGGRGRHHAAGAQRRDPPTRPVGARAGPRR